MGAVRRFITRRLGHGIVIMALVTVVVFVITRMIGDPIAAMVSQETSAEVRAQLAATYGFDKSIPAQFLDYIAGIFRGDLGTSLWQGRPTLEIVFDVLPKTFQLVLSATGFAILIGFPIGVLAALRPGGIIDRISITGSLLGLSVPQFWLGLLFIMFFSVQLGWFPTSGAGSWRHLVLPMLTLGLPASARLAMLVRSSMIDQLNEPYVLTARAKGLAGFRVNAIHAFRNASTAGVTLAGWELMRMLAGYAVVVETVFSWPGIGLLAFQTIERRDLILLQAIVLMVAVFVVLINIVMDIVYKIIDRRVQLN